MTALLELTRVSFRYRARNVLENVNISLEQGSCTALVGPNGAGKTTLLRLISGGLTPTSGFVFLNGQNLAQSSRQDRAKQIALVPQSLAIPFDFTVEQIVSQGRAPYLGLFRSAGEEDFSAVERALDLAEVRSMRRRIFNELSGGEKQRVKIALALAQSPSLLLLDEPTQNLDIGRQMDLMQLLRQLLDDGVTIVAAIHDLNLVRDNFSMVHLLAEGQPMISGPADQVMVDANLSTMFQVSPQRSTWHATDLAGKDRL